jgi:xanthine dehydrogenase accessory factor
MITIKAFWQKVQTQLKANNPVILAMVMEKKGSAPRGVGAHMLILSDGSTVDTIGGGPLEYLAIQEAKQNLKNGKSIVQTFSLNNATAGEYGMWRSVDSCSILFTAKRFSSSGKSIDFNQYEK